jgi:hypothetical protein
MPLKLIAALKKIIAEVYSIPPKIKPNIKVEGDISNIGNWKAKVILANSGGHKEEWNDVGYVGFDYKTATIIPIARSDEHHRGEDLLDYYLEHKLIPKRNYKLIWSNSFSANYLHNDAALKEMIPVYKKWLEIGGANLKIKINKKMFSFQDAIDGVTSGKEYEGELAPYAKQFVKLLEKAAVLYKRYLTKKSVKIEDIGDVVLELGEFLKAHKSLIREDSAKFIEKVEKAGSNIIQGKDIEENMKIIFGFDGLKNKIHTYLKGMIKSTNEYSIDRAKEFFGDINFAYEEFNRLSAI